MSFFDESELESLVNESQAKKSKKPLPEKKPRGQLSHSEKSLEHLISQLNAHSVRQLEHLSEESRKQLLSIAEKSSIDSRVIIESLANLAELMKSEKATKENLLSRLSVIPKRDTRGLAERYDFTLRKA